MLTYGLITFAAAFFVVGVYRIVEFKAAGVSDFQRRLLIPVHIVGCGLFSASMVLVAIDPLQQHKQLLTWLFFSGLFLLFPMHIYVGIKRMIRMNR
jgi:hypothetical protein